MSEGKSEIRRPKSDPLRWNDSAARRNSKSERSSFGIPEFGFVSDFGIRISVLAVSCLALAVLAQTNVLYQNDFKSASVGKLPDDFLVIDGAFTVKEESGNKFLELPGTPLDSYAVQFGPAETSNIAVSARIRGTAKGRRYPTFGVGLNGVAGYRLQVSPAKQSLELYRDQQLKSTVPFEWKPGEWTNLRLQIRQSKEGELKIEGKAWLQSEPDQWSIVADDKQKLPEGRPSVFGSPFSGTPIQFDRLQLARVHGE